MTLFRMIYGYEAILPIELEVLTWKTTWKTLPWNPVQTRADLIAMRARQIGGAMKISKRKQVLICGE
jgi:hypothetical protein